MVQVLRTAIEKSRKNQPLWQNFVSTYMTTKCFTAASKTKFAHKEKNFLKEKTLDIKRYVQPIITCSAVA
jgi:hypothetical protein